MTSRGMRSFSKSQTLDLLSYKSMEFHSILNKHSENSLEFEKF